VDNVPDILAAITPIVEALEELGIPYHIGGSIASSLYGIPRLTIDVDLVADIRMEHVRPLAKQLETDYYIKLEWYRMGGEVSDRQWNDILGVLKVQGTNLDMSYLQKWAANLSVTDLLERALVDAGLQD
jgi:hypothetical protein